MSESFMKRGISGKKYDYFSKDIVRILNIKQAMAFIAYKVELLDIYISKDRKTGEPVLVFVFDKESSAEAYDLWCQHKLPIDIDE